MMVTRKVRSCAGIHLLAIDVMEVYAKPCNDGMRGTVVTFAEKREKCHNKYNSTFAEKRENATMKTTVVTFAEKREKC